MGLIQNIFYLLWGNIDKDEGHFCLRATAVSVRGKEFYSGAIQKWDSRHRKLQLG